MSKIDEQVAEFHRVFGIVDRDTPGIPDEKTVRLRMRLVLEETFELLDACIGDTPAREYIEGVHRRLRTTIEYARLEPKLDKVADALGDIDYVVAGSRLAFGIPQGPIADEIHSSNLAKAPGGVVSRDDGGKVQKPLGWKPPDIAGVLRAHGWKP